MLVSIRTKDALHVALVEGSGSSTPTHSRTPFTEVILI